MTDYYDKIGFGTYWSGDPITYSFNSALGSNYGTLSAKFLDQFIDPNNLGIDELSLQQETVFQSPIKEKTCSGFHITAQMTIIILSPI